MTYTPDDRKKLVEENECLRREKESAEDKWRFWQSATHAERKEKERMVLVADSLNDAGVKLVKEIERLKAELDEEARLSGKGASREAQLLGEVDRLKRELAINAAERNAYRELCRRSIQDEVGNDALEHVDYEARRILEGK